MKSLLLALLSIVNDHGDAPAELVPTEPKKPLFTISEIQFDPPAGNEKPMTRLLSRALGVQFEEPRKNGKPITHQAHAGKELLTVYSLSDLLMQKDQRGVRVVLNAKDTKTFAALTHQYEYLSLLAGDSSSGVIMHITAPIEDGSIMFNQAHSSEPVAQYLRKRFQLKPNANEPAPAKRK